MAPRRPVIGMGMSSQHTACLTSALGHSRPMHSAQVRADVRCYSNSDQIADLPRATLRARSGREHVQQGASKTGTYSITSSARTSSDGGTVRPSDFVALRL